MIENLGKHKRLWFLNGFLSLVAALIGVTKLDIYNGVVGAEVLPGVLSQDLLTVVVGLLLLFLAYRSKAGAAREQIVILGLLGYLFYAYGIYAIEQVYNSLYFLYLALFGLSFYSMIYGVASIRQEVLQQVALPDRIRKVAVGFSLFIAIFFSLLWIMMLIPLLQSGDRIDNLYSIFILDLSFIMPAYAILAVLTARKKGLGIVLTPAMYVLGVTLLFPVGLGELFKPVFELPIDPGGLVLYFGVSAAFLVISVIYLRQMTVPAKDAGLPAPARPERAY